MAKPTSTTAQPSSAQPPPLGNAWAGKKSFVSVLLDKADATLSATTGARYKGLPAANFSEDDIQILADKHKRALVGYFYKSRPPMTTLRKSFEIIGFKGGFHLGLLEKKHVLIRFDLEEDYIRCWNRQKWDIYGNVMKVTKWSPDFQPNVESPIVPVWLTFEGLPIHLHDKRAMFVIASLIGTPLKLDIATTTLARPSLARVCVELDLTKEMPSKVWIQTGKTGFTQSVIYENKPQYCLSCLHLGHVAHSCPMKLLEGKSEEPEKLVEGKKTINAGSKWVAKLNTQHTSTGKEGKGNDQHRITAPETSAKEKGKAIVVYAPANKQVTPQPGPSSMPQAGPSFKLLDEQTIIQDNAESDTEEIFHEEPPAQNKEVECHNEKCSIQHMIQGEI
ncbi:unnamed protein product, partial [Cuscuta epithymum]